MMRIPKSFLKKYEVTNITIRRKVKLIDTGGKFYFVKQALITFLDGRIMEVDVDWDLIHASRDRNIFFDSEIIFGIIAQVEDWDEIRNKEKNADKGKGKILQ